jgi:membrane protease YdiL (CAAX protease family)
VDPEQADVDASADVDVDADSHVVPRWGIGDAIGGFLLGNTLVVLFVGIWAGVTGRSELSFGAIALGQVALWIGLLGVPLWATARKGSGSVARDFGLVVRAADAMRGIPIGVVCQLVLVPLIYLPFRTFIDVDKLDEPARQLADKAHGFGFVALAVVLVVGAPIIEELFFRGLLLRAIERRFGPAWALAGSSLGFALAHLEGLQFPALLAVGVVFGLLAQRSGRLGPSIFAHAAFNCVVVIALALARR